MPLLGGTFFSGAIGGGSELTIDGTPVTTAQRDIAYDGFTVSAAGGIPPYTYSVFSGALPDGITLNASTGEVSGTPTEIGSFAGIVIRVTDSALETADLATFSIAVSGMPDDAVVWLDFVNETYIINGSPVVITDVLGGGFDAGEISAAGMSVTAGDSNRPNAIGALLTELISEMATGATFLVSFTWDQPSDGNFFDVYDGATSATSTDYWAIWTSGGELYIYDNQTLDLTLAGSQVTATGERVSLSYTGLNNVAVTIGRDLGGGSYQYALEANGDDAVTENTAYNPSVTAVDVFALFHWDGDDPLEAFIRSIAVLPAVDPTALPALTALPWPRIRGWDADLTGAATSHPVTIPTHDNGEMLVVIFSCDGNPTVSIGSGTNWNMLGQASNGSATTGAVFWKIADGTDALTIATSASEGSTSTTIRIANADTIEGVPSNGNGADSDPAELTPSGGAKDYLWLATRSGDSFDRATSGPTNFNNYLIGTEGNSAGASTDVAEVVLNAAVLNPAAFDSPSNPWVCWTLAIAPPA